jgi:hypothetical protein
MIATGKLDLMRRINSGTRSIFEQLGVAWIYIHITLTILTFANKCFQRHKNVYILSFHYSLCLNNTLHNIFHFYLFNHKEYSIKLQYMTS